MYKIKYDGIKNRIYVTVEGSLKMDEMEQYTNEFKAAVDRSKAGFTVCVDNTKAGVNTPEVGAKLDENKIYAANKGLKNAAMVVDSTIFKMQMKRLFKELGNVFQSVADADKFLDTAPDFRQG